MDGALQISTDFYQMHREQLQKWIDKIQENSVQDQKTIIAEIEKINPNIKYYFRPKDDVSVGVLTYVAIQKLREENKKSIIWPGAEHARLYAVILLKGDVLLEIDYPLPDSFQSAAKSIQEVNQIYKTLGFVQSDIRRSFLLTFLFIYVIGVILALVISYFISRKITKPIERLVLAADEIGTIVITGPTIVDEGDSELYSVTQSNNTLTDVVWDWSVTPFGASIIESNSQAIITYNQPGDYTITAEATSATATNSPQEGTLGVTANTT